MNGTAVIENVSMVDRRPIITCAGELEVFSTIEDNLAQALPQDSCDWKRSLGRLVRSVHIGATFTPFSPVALPKVNQWDLIRQPLFHIYWTECMDIDLYRNSVREDIENWLKELTAKEIQDWLIVVVENYDGKKANKLLPRTTVLDKIRADFAPKQGDRCISVINPLKVESRSADSWRGLVARIRHLLLVAYTKAVSQLEDHVRQQREKRNEIGWDFMHYFYLQEELAQVLEMLGLNDEALIQYDELDALFSQFVANGITSECVNWLSGFQKPLEKWHGLKLGPSKLQPNPSILELRAYLFAKQAHMLLLTNKVWEMAARCLPFLHTCVREVACLDITAPPGAVACWLFLASMEVLQTSEKFNHTDEVEDYSLHTASLWDYASQKIRILGELCGLLPGSTPTSEQLHTVVQLSAGMGDNPGTPNQPSPTDKLKEALCSQDTFHKIYLELAELAMGTYKHIGRLRSARLVGREIASFYMLLGDIQKAAVFLGDVLRTFEQDQWRELVAHTQIELVDCFRKAVDIRNLVKACTFISSTIEIDTLIRWTYFDEMQKCLDLLDEPLVVPCGEIVKIISVGLTNDIIMQDSIVIAELVIESNFPREVMCTNLVISLEAENKDHKRGSERCNVGRVLTRQDLKAQDPMLQRLTIKRNLDYKQDKQLATAGIASKFTELRRKSSAVMTTYTQGDFTNCLKVGKLPIVITPGINVIRLNKQASQVGKYYLRQVSIDVKNLHLISAILSPRVTLDIKEEGPTLKLYKRAAPLLLGIEQIMNLILTIGSYKIKPKSKIKIIASSGLSLQVKADEPLTNTIEIEIGENHPFTSSRTSLRVLASMLSKDHQVTIHCPWMTKPMVVVLNFTPPLSVTWRMHTVMHRKFIQVYVTGQCDQDLLVDEAKLNMGQMCNVEGRNCKFGQAVSNSLTFSYLWELLPKLDNEIPTLKAEFTIKYKLDEKDSDNKLYQYFFDINDYQTLYILDAEVEPAKGNEFCRAGIVCHLHLSIRNVGLPLHTNNNMKSVMYEVLAEQSVWAVCGRTAGVICFDSNEKPQTVVLDVMPLTSGHLPLPLVRISKYIPAECGNSDKSTKGDNHPRLEPFSLGQVYNRSKGKQLHVIAASSEGYQ